MAGRRVRLEVAGVTATCELLEGLSPKMAAAFWASLPLKGTLIHGKWSGLACCFLPGSSPMEAVTELESPVGSIYPGTIVARPAGREILMSYGPAEYRSAIGTEYTTPIAKIVENREKFLGILRRMHDEGDKPISIEREG